MLGFGKGLGEVVNDGLSSFFWDFGVLFFLGDRGFNLSPESFLGFFVHRGRVWVWFSGVGLKVLGFGGSRLRVFSSVFGLLLREPGFGDFGPVARSFRGLPCFFSLFVGKPSFF